MLNLFKIFLFTPLYCNNNINIVISTFVLSFMLSVKQYTSKIPSPPGLQLSLLWKIILKKQWLPIFKGFLFVWLYLIFSMNLWGRYYYTHLIDSWINIFSVSNYLAILQKSTGHALYLGIQYSVVTYVGLSL